MRAAMLRPGQHLAGLLPPIAGVRDRPEIPVVRRVRRILHNHQPAKVHVQWLDGSRAEYLPDDEVTLLDESVQIGTADYGRLAMFDGAARPVQCPRCLRRIQVRDGRIAVHLRHPSVPTETCDGSGVELTSLDADGQAVTR